MEATVACRVEAAILGTYCEGGECRPLKVLFTGMLYENDDWVVAFHPPADPMAGQQISSSDRPAFRGIWRAMAMGRDELSPVRG